MSAASATKSTADCSHNPDATGGSWWLPLRVDLKKTLSNLIEKGVPVDTYSRSLISGTRDWTAADRQQVLNELAQHLANPKFTLHVARSTRPLHLDLAMRVLHIHQKLVGNSSPSSLTNDDVYDMLSHLLYLSPHLTNITDNADVQYRNSTIELTYKQEQTLIRQLTFILRFIDLGNPMFLTSIPNYQRLCHLLSLSASPQIQSLCNNILCHSWSMHTPIQTPLETCNYVLGTEQKALDRALPFTSESSQLCGTVLCQAHSAVTSMSDKLTPLSTMVECSPCCHTWCAGTEDLVSQLTEVCGVLLPTKSRTKLSSESTQPKFVSTQTTMSNLHALALAISQGSPVLLEGPTGAGKTSLVEFMAALTGNNDMIKVHLGDQADAKTLLGSYIATDIPSEFKWQPGPLTQAVQEGMWILIEDIDLAPHDVQSVLLPILETRWLFIPGRGEMCEAQPGFQLFATRTLTRGPDGGLLAGRQSTGGALLGGMWTRVSMDPHSKIYRLENKNQWEHLPKIHRLDLFKWVVRVHARLDSQIISTLTPETPLSSYLAEIIFLEGVDCFCMVYPQGHIREFFVNTLASCWGMFADRVTYYTTLYRPPIQSNGGRLTIGRVTLPLALCGESSTSSRFTAGKPISGTPKDVELVDRSATPGRVGSPSTDSDIKPVGVKRSVSPGVPPSTQSSTNIPIPMDSTSPEDIVVNAPSRQTGNLPFAYTSHVLRTMERIAACVARSEPVLLVGETGTGKTATVQHLAQQLHQKLVVQNLNEQTESSDLLGGFRPVELQRLCEPLMALFETLFPKTFSRQANADFLCRIRATYINKDWNSFWAEFADMLESFVLKRDQLHNKFAFSFVEGALVKAVKNGEWLLLDEINLASTETLESLSGLLEGGSLTLIEAGNIEPVPRHPNFRLFACMNPPTDVGKKELPPGLRSRFTELFIDEMVASEDLTIVVQEYLKTLVHRIPVEPIVSFYLEARKLASTSLSDGANQRPDYSLRTLCRALQYTVCMTHQYGFNRALYDGFSMSFLTQLNQQSLLTMENLLLSKLDPKGITHNHLHAPPKPQLNAVQFEGFWLPHGSTSSLPITPPANYIITPSIRSNLRNLARAVVLGKYPVLLQGPTSAGKTSMVEYIAQCTGHKFVRINNHEHTDVQEYFGSYVGTETGKLVFQEGILVEAVRKGYWVVLDELNLAPSEVLEALNRLLDTNRELFIPETQEVVTPHPQFMLFATQNPPGLYGGRKVLSRAFRNRFLELHIEEIPDPELETILTRRCIIPPSYSAKIVSVMKELQRNRTVSEVFSGKHAFVTLRDLFRWAQRHPSSLQELAEEGYCLLAERLRKPEDKLVIKQALEKYMKVEINVESIFASATASSVHAMTQASIEKSNSNLTGQTPIFDQIVWTPSMQRLFTLLNKCFSHKEPVLLVGVTGSAKTTVCQVWAELAHSALYMVNCHQHTETADFLGGLRPVRSHSQTASSLHSNVLELSSSIGIEPPPDNQELQISELMSWFSKVVEPVAQKSDLYKTSLKIISDLHTKYNTLFEWCDGPLVKAMKDGSVLLLDEISLAEDAVLERLNSVLEPSRLLVLAEKNATFYEELYANPAFQIVATMNPGGDYGKRELSPAMRNRFTEIWVPQLDPVVDYAHIIQSRIHASLTDFVPHIINFVMWFSAKQRNQQVMSIRDVLGWVDFMNTSVIAKKTLSPYQSFINGACLVLLDGVGISLGLHEEAAHKLRNDCLGFLRDSLLQDTKVVSLMTSTDSLVESTISVHNTGTHLVIGPFAIQNGAISVTSPQYIFGAPTTARNSLRMVRALQLPRAILLEGSPGVGKTSLVSALAAASGHKFTRINLSEHTDMSDLVGADLPTEDGMGGEFSWRDGVFLRALKEGHWVLLDELNLASQAVLEGLNSCLDHRTSIYIPEIDRTFHCLGEFRIFACQNPTNQGGGRKGLPKSFLNRFTQVFIDKLGVSDMSIITAAMYPQIEPHVLAKMIQFTAELSISVCDKGLFGRTGGPWEFNLRDLFRWCDCLTKPVQRQREKMSPTPWDYAQYVELVFISRLRTEEDKKQARELYKKIMGCFPHLDNRLDNYLSPSIFQVGHSWLMRSDPLPSFLTRSNLELLQSFTSPLQHIMKCIEMGWLTILVGPTASGKTSLVRLLSVLTGNRLHEFSMNSSVDTMELLGGYEQVDVHRHKKRTISLIQDLVHSCSVTLFARSKDQSCDPTGYCLSALQQLQDHWAAFSFREKFHNRSPMLDPEQQSALENLMKHIDTLLKLGLPIEQDRVISARTALSNYLSSVQTLQLSGRFEWIDGLLIQAMERGEWVLIDNVNFCNPTVLDRLNSVLEPNGVLSVTERGVLADGKIKEVRPHSRFRIFFTMDPRNGEVSRAMRNRGIEIFVPPMQASSEDTIQILNSIGIPGSEIPSTMAEFHTNVSTHMQSLSEWGYSMRDLLHFAQLTLDQAQKGMGLILSLYISMEQVYLRPCRNPEHANFIKLQFSALFNKWNKSNPDFFAPAHWPMHCTTQLACQNAVAGLISRQGSFLRHLQLKALHVPDGEHGQSSLQVAGQYFIEVSSLDDWDHRLAVLNSWSTNAVLPSISIPVGNNSIKDVRAKVEIFSSVLQKLYAHPAVTELKCGWSKLAEVLGAPLTRMQTTERGANLPLFMLYDLCLQTPSPEPYTAFYHILTRVQMLRRVIFLSVVEANEYDESTQVSTLSAVQRSWAIFMGTKDSSIAQTEWEYLLYPFFHFLWESLLSWLAASISPCGCMQSPFNEFLRDVHCLWGMLARGPPLPGIPVDIFAPCWRRLVRQVKKLESGLEHCCCPCAAIEGPQNSQDGSHMHTHIEWTSNFRTVTDKLDTAMMAYIDTMPVWKFIHPPALKHNWEYAALSDCLGLFRCLEADTQALWEWSVFPLFSSQFKRIMVESVVTVAGVMQTSPEEVTQISELLKSQVTEEQKKIQSHSEEYSQNDDSLLWPFFDYISMAQELELISRLYHSTASAMTDGKKGVLTSSETVVAKCRSLLKLMLDQSSRSPVDASPYLEASWRLTKEDNTETVRRLVPLMYASFHLRSWRTSFDDTTQEPYLCGPSRLLQSVITHLSVNTMARYDQVSISASKTRATKMTSLTKLLLETPPVTALSMQCSLLISTFVETILALEKYFDKTQWVSVIYPTLTSWQKLPGAAEEKVTRTSKEEFTQALRTCSERRYHSVIDLLVVPLIEILWGLTPSVASTLPGELLAIGRVPCDPVMSKNSKLKTQEKILSDLDIEISTRTKIEQILTGKESNGTIRGLQSEAHRRKLQCDTLKDQFIDRPSTSDFIALFNEVHRFSTMIGSIEKVLELLNLLVQSKGPHGKNKYALEKEEAWQAETLHFIKNFEHRFSSYRDVSNPIVLSVLSIKYGMHVTAYCVSSVNSTSEPLLQLSLTFPHLECIDKAICHARQDASKLESLSPASLSTVLQSFLSGTLLFCNAVNKQISEDSRNIISAVFSNYHQEWERRQTVKREKEEEEAKLFKFKARTITLDVEGVGEKQREAMDMERLFPDFRDAYADIVIPQPDEEHEEEEGEKRSDTSEKKTDQCLEATDDSNCLLKNLTDDDLALIVTKPNTDEGLPVSLEIESKENCCNVAMSSYLSHLFSEVPQDTPDFNIYKIAKIPEARLLVDPLKNVITRVRVILEEWPDQEVLKQLVQLSQRILTFSVSSPLIKFLTGLELLLTQAQKWEASASRNLSLSEVLLPISQLVARWRKVELSSWKAVLEDRANEISGKAFQWWFHLYSAVQTNEANNAEQNQCGLKEFQANLEHFMDTSSLGEFETRLTMLLSFHNHLLNDLRGHQNPHKQLLSNILWNTFKYYAMHSPKVKQAIDTQKAEIEKELIDFVKIAKWDKLDYYFLKERADKSHKTLLKYCRKYEKILLAPAVECFTPSDEHPNGETALDLENEKTVPMLQVFLSIASIATHNLPVNLPLEIPLLSKGLSHLITKMDKFCTCAILPPVQGLYGTSGFLAIESLCSDALTRIYDLQHLQTQTVVTPSVVTPTSSSGVKAGSTTSDISHTQGAVQPASGNPTSTKTPGNPPSIPPANDRNMKHMAFVEMIKKLRHLGLSGKPKYIKHEKVDMTSFMQQLPSPSMEQIVNLLVSKTTFASKSLMKSVLNWHEKGDVYYYRCIQKFGSLKTAARMHSKDLTLSEVQRSCTYVSNLFSVAAVHRMHLLGALSQCSTLLCMCGELALLAPSSNAESTQDTPTSSTLPDQTSMKECLGLMSEHVLFAVQYLTELSVLLQSIARPLHQLASKSNLDSEVHLVVSACLQRYSRLQSQINDCDFDKCIIFTKQCSEILSEYIKEFEEVSSAMRKLTVLPVTVAASVSSFILRTEETLFKVKARLIRTPTPISSSITSEQVDTNVAQVLRHVVFSVQELKRLAEHPASPEMPALSTTGEQTNAGFLEKESSLIDTCEANTKILHILNISVFSTQLRTMLTSLAEFIQVNNSAERLAYITQHCRSAYPVVSRYLGVVTCLLSLQLGFQKSINKMAYITLSILHTLFSQGFCTPPKSDDSTQPSETKFSDDVEGTGMGNGQGKKDVSDEIEDEDQLAGTNKDKEDNQPPAEQTDLDKGVDTKGDLDGDLQDKPENEDENEEPEEEPDREMGEMDDAQVIDKRMWEESDNEPDENEKPDREEVESGMSEKKANTDQTMAAPTEEEMKEKKKKKNKKETPKGELVEQDENEQDAGEGEEEEQDPDDNPDNQVTDEPPTNDQHVDEREDLGDLELPAPSGDEEDEDESEEKQEEMEPELDQEGLEDALHPEQSEKQPPELGGLEEVKPDEKEEEGEDESKPEGGTDKVEDEKEDNGNKDSTAPTEVGQEAQENEENEEDKKGEDPSANNTQPSNTNVDTTMDDKDSDTKPEDNAPAPKSDTVGIKDTTSHAGAEVQEVEDKDEENKNQEEACASEEQSGGQPASGQQESTSIKNGKERNEASDIPNSRSMPKPNPHNSLGDALKEWKRLLKVIDSTNNPAKEDENEASNPAEEDGNENSLHRYVHEEEEEKAEKAPQALGPSTEENQVMIPEPEKPQPETEVKPEKAEEEKPEEDRNTDLPSTLPSMKSDFKKNRFVHPKSQKSAISEDTEPIVISDDEGIPQENDASNIVSTGYMSSNQPAPPMEVDSIQTHPVDSTLECDTDLGKAMEKWREYDMRMSQLAQELCENLRITLEPTQATQLRGDYRTGKRINMKKVIPYIASQYKKDKIWLRRTRPHARRYHVVLAIDNSESMRHNHAGETALCALALISRALARLEVGELALVSFGTEASVVRPLCPTALSDTEGAQAVSRFTFLDKSTNLSKLLTLVLPLLAAARLNAPTSVHSTQFLQIVFILSDGRFGERESLQKWVLEASGRRVLLVFIILDNPAANSSILDLQTISYPGGKLTVNKYMDTFPFNYYIVVRSISALPETLASAIRQWFELLKQ
ncbi:AAA ATPase midasin [Pelomyxa schiedti]|nr:AAA ATPase midasin [Pelomyxa schiedti]